NTYTWPLQHRRVQEILPSLEQLMAPYPIVADPARNLIIFNGTPEDRQKVEQLVNVFDVPSASLSLELVVLGPGGTHAADVDAPIAKQLSELGLSGYGTQSRSLVRALENGPFSLTEVSVAAERKLHFKGEIRLNENGRLATLDFSLSLEQAKADRIQLDTTIRIPVADRVLLGLTTTGSGKEPLVLVARVTRDDLGR
ncbi:MAG: secretin N-terminal domain-containing protein, partial [Planctomycetota bacterium]